MTPEEALKVKQFRERLELLFAWKEAEMMAFDEEENRMLGQPLNDDPMRDATIRHGEGPSPIEIVIEKLEREDPNLE